MPISPRLDFITPFADESMRLLRETWANPTMLSEELFAIFQQKIPLNRSGPINVNLLYGTDQNAITLRQNGDGDFISFVNKFKQTVATLNSNGDLVKTTQAERNRGGRATPAIDWSDPADITQGTALSGTQLNAVARDAISGYEIAGTYEYSPASGTVLSAGDNQPLAVVFTPTNTTSYKRGRKTVFIDVNAAAIALVASVGSSIGGSTTLNRTASYTAGNLSIVFVGIQDDADIGITIMVSDTHGNVYTQAGSYVRETIGGGGSRQMTLAAFWAVTSTTGVATVTATLSAAADFGMTVNTFEGTHPSSPIIATNTNHANQPSGSPYTATTGSVGAASGNAIIACFLNGGDSVTVGAGYTTLGLSTAFAGIAERHMAVSGAEAATATGTSLGTDGSTYCAIGIAIGSP